MINNDNYLFERVRELCVCTAKAIVQISNETGIHPRLVSKLFMEVMQTILDEVDKDGK